MKLTYINTILLVCILVVLIVACIGLAIYLNIQSIENRVYNNLNDIKREPIEIVISVFEEDISWIKTIPTQLYNHIYIYNKGSEKFYEFPNTTVINLPNIGYEAHTYLYHITTNYDKLGNTTLFLPGTAWTREYKKMKMLQTIEFLKTNDESVGVGYSDSESIEKEKSTMVDSYTFSNSLNRKHNPDTKLFPAEIRPYGKWFHNRFKGEKPHCITYNGIFAASKYDILKRSKAFYTKLLNEVSYKNPEASHYIERSWSSIVSIPSKNCIAPYIPEFMSTIQSIGYRFYQDYGINMQGRNTDDLQMNNLKMGVLAIFKNEATVIREWLEHYKWQGVDHIVLLDNNSTDNWQDEIKGYENMLTIIPAKLDHAQGKHYQILGLPALKERSIDIVAILDIDEYMFGTDGMTLKDHCIKQFGKVDRPSRFSCLWTMFGSSGYERQPRSIRESFIWKADNSNKKNIPAPFDNVKSVYWVNDIENKDINPHKTDVSGKSLDCPQGIQLNHYAIMSKQYFKDIKMTRGAADTAKHANIRDWNYFNRYDVKDLKDIKLQRLVQNIYNNMK